MTTMTLDYDKLYGGLTDVLAGTVAQTVNSELAARLDPLLVEAGKFNAKAKTKKAVPMVSTEAMTGETS